MPFFSLSARFVNIALFVLLTTTWSFTWFSAKFLVNSSALMPELLAGYRFLVASIVLFIGSVIFRLQLKPSFTEVKSFAIASLFGCSVNLFLFYYAAKYLFSGFSAVVFSMVIILNLVIGTLFGIKQTNFTKIFLLSIMGVCGLFCVIASHTGFLGVFSVNMLKGIGLSFLGTLCFSISSVYFQTRKFALHPTVCFAYMAFIGFLWCLLFALLHCYITGIFPQFLVQINIKELIAFLYLAIFGTAIGYLCSFLLGRRIGSVKTGYSSLITPVVASLISSFYEGYNFTPLALIGFTLILTSELFALTDKKIK